MTMQDFGSLVNLHRNYFRREATRSLRWRESQLIALRSMMKEHDCTLQPIIHELPFGGVGDSGMGEYHGEWGFRTYTNARGVLYHSTLVDFGGVRYPPYEHNRRLRELVMPS